MTSKISMIAAIGRGRELGKGNDLLWKIPDDLKRFREITKGHPCVMGRKTFESIVAILKKPLPNRTNIVITRNAEHMSRYHLDMSVAAAGSMEEAIQLAKRKPGGEEVFIIGGGQIYELGLSYADKLYLTLIDANPPAGGADSFFPEYEKVFTRKVFEEGRAFEGLKYTWVDLER